MLNLGKVLGLIVAVVLGIALYGVLGYSYTIQSVGLGILAIYFAPIIFLAVLGLLGLVAYYVEKVEKLNYLKTL